MKILWFTTTPSKGADFLNHKEVGSGWVESLETSLSENENIEIGVAFLWKGEKIQPYKINKTSYYPIAADSEKGKLNQFYSRWSHKVSTKENVQKYLKVVEDFAPDIIHIFGSENDYGMLIPEVSIPCIVHIQGSLILCNHKWYNGLTQREVYKYSDKWLLLRGHGLYHIYFNFKKAADRERIIFKNSKFLIGRTDWDKRVSSVLSPAAKYFHCDEIMRQKFYSHQWKSLERNDSYVIISVIRNNIFKGLETVYEAKKMLSLQFPAFNPTWKIVGIEEKDEVACLVKEKYKHSFGSIGIQLLGPLQEDDLIKEMLEADLFVHPSHIENSSNSICEAMLLGMPLIATYVGGTSSLLNDKKEGLLIQDGDPYSLAGAIIELSRNKDYAGSLGRNARVRAMLRHDQNKIVNNVINIYSSIITK